MLSSDFGWNLFRFTKNTIVKLKYWIMVGLNTIPPAIINLHCFKLFWNLLAPQFSIKHVLYFSGDEQHCPSSSPCRVGVGLASRLCYTQLVAVNCFWLQCFLIRKRRTLWSKREQTNPSKKCNLFIILICLSMINVWKYEVRTIILINSFLFNFPFIWLFEIAVTKIFSYFDTFIWFSQRFLNRFPFIQYRRVNFIPNKHWNILTVFLHGQPAVNGRTKEHQIIWFFVASHSF